VDAAEHHENSDSNNDESATTSRSTENHEGLQEQRKVRALARKISALSNSGITDAPEHPARHNGNIRQACIATIRNNKKSHSSITIISSWVLLVAAISLAVRNEQVSRWIGVSYIHVTTIPSARSILFTIAVMYICTMSAIKTYQRAQKVDHPSTTWKEDCPSPSTRQLNTSAAKCQ
jgi:hypothetical protein